MKRVGWLDMAEVGGVLGIRLLVVVSTVFGRAPARWLLHPVVLYYWVFGATARRASRNWLEKVYAPRHVTRTMTYEHMLRFAQVALDRLFLVRGQTRRFDIRIHDRERFLGIHRSGRGVIFLGAHLGSFEALCAVADTEDVRINIVGYFRNARMINAALRRLDPRSHARLISIQPGKIDFIFEIQDRVDRGEHIAILGDRVGLGKNTVEVKFMGSRAHLPTGVYLLAAILRCPVYLIFALYRDRNRYDVHCEEFADRIVLPRRARDPAIAKYAQRFADRLEHYGRIAPYNWFNFFDFWS